MLVHQESGGLTRLNADAIGQIIFLLGQEDPRSLAKSILDAPQGKADIEIHKSFEWEIIGITVDDKKAK